MALFVEWSFWIARTVARWFGGGHEQGTCHTGDPAQARRARRDPRTGLVQYESRPGDWIGYASFHWRNFKKEI